jgi:hypothetical protein
MRKNLVLFTFILLILGFSIFSNYAKIYAQLLPMPPLFTDKKTDSDKGNTGRNDHQPPIVQFLTSKLTQGKNVFRIKIIDESGIKSCEIKYTNRGIFRTTDCVYDQNSIYKSLISATPPSQTVQVYARDFNGNSVTTIKNLNVNPGPSLPGFLSNIFATLFHNYHY